jgi:tetratricopeptide (TPR) repeat protein
VLLALQKYKEVRASLDSALHALRHPELVLQDAFLRLKTQDYAGARSAADEVLRRNPEDVRAAGLLAESYAAQKQMVSAVGRLSELAAGHPKSAPLQELLGRWQIKAGHLPEARKAFEAAKAADPAFSTADLDLAQLDRQENHVDRAVERLTVMVTADTKNIPALLLLAAINEDANDTEAAIVRYRAILNIDSANLYALNNLAYHVALTDTEEALKLAQGAMEAAPGDPSIQDTMGWVYYRKGSYQTAVQHFKSAVDKDPTPKHQFHLALSYLKIGEQNLGRQMLQSALQRDPNLTKTERGW